MADEANSSEAPCSGCGGGADRPDAMGRRTFMKTASGVLVGIGGVTVGVPMVWSVVGTIYRIGETPYAKVAPLSRFQSGEPEAPIFPMAQHEAYMHGTILHDVWVIKHSESSVTVFSPICPHLGCHYNWSAKARKFICPCHGSVYSMDGKVLGGPAPRGLDTLPHKIENGDVYVKWERFRVGIPSKVRIG